MKACRKCGAPARIRWAPGKGRARFYVWAECTMCGARTIQFIDSKKPAEDTPGGKWAVLAWNSGANQKTNRIGGTI